MIRREGYSEFIEGMKISKRGSILKVASIKDAKRPGVETKEDAINLLKKFDKSPDIKDEHIDEHKEKIEQGEDPRDTIKQFFKGLPDAKKSKNTMTIKTAKLLRQAGMFKMTEKDLYQDLITSDFWKISEDGKNVVRVFKEKDGIADKSAKKKDYSNNFSTI